MRYKSRLKMMCQLDIQIALRGEKEQRHSQWFHATHRACRVNPLPTYVCNGRKMCCFFCISNTVNLWLPKWTPKMTISHAELSLISVSDNERPLTTRLYLLCCIAMVCLWSSSRALSGINLLLCFGNCTRNSITQEPHCLRQHNRPHASKEEWT